MPQSPQHSPSRSHELWRLYIDEVGNHDLKHVDDERYRYLSLTGVMFECRHMLETVQPQFRSLRNKFFQGDPDEPVIFHRKEMINYRGAFRVLREEVVRREFDAALLELLRKWHYRVITVVIDKKEHLETYSTWRYHPYHYCLHVMMERYILELGALNCRGDVMVEQRGGVEDRKLKESFKSLYDNGTDHVQADKFKQRLTSHEVKMKPKRADVCGLQIADIIAHPSWKDVLQEYGKGNVGDTFGRRICEILRAKYRRNPETKAIKGFGKKLLP